MIGLIVYSSQRWGSWREQKYLPFFILHSCANMYDIDACEEQVGAHMCVVRQPEINDGCFPPLLLRQGLSLISLDYLPASSRDQPVLTSSVRVLQCPPWQLPFTWVLGIPTQASPPSHLLKSCSSFSTKYPILYLLTFPSVWIDYTGFLKNTIKGYFVENYQKIFILS